MNTSTPSKYEYLGGGIPWGRVRCVIENCKRKLYRRYRGEALWVLVRDITGHGSGVSRDICKVCGFDPDQNISSKPLKLIEV